MKFFLLLFSCLLLTGCQWKESFTGDSSTTVENLPSFSPTFTLKEGIELPSAPETFEEIVAVLERMVVEDVMYMEVPYPYDLVDLGLYESYLYAYQRAYQKVNATHIEYTSNTMVYYTGYKKDDSGNFFMALERDDERYTETEIMEQNAYFRQRVQEIFDYLKESGQYTENKTEMEQIKVLYDFTAGHLSYDYDYEYADSAFTAYGAVTVQQVVCQGYVALFNALLRLAGFQAEGVIGVSMDSGERHIWTQVKLGDTWHYFDPTYGDRPTWTAEEGDLQFNYTYFDMTEETMLYDRKITHYQVNNDTLILP
ncbi:MAG: transglutaminase domain-containing protein [Eubacteriales bacterium]